MFSTNFNAGDANDSNIQWLIQANKQFCNFLQPTKIVFETHTLGNVNIMKSQAFTNKPKPAHQKETVLMLTYLDILRHHLPYLLIEMNQSQNSKKIDKNVQYQLTKLE